MPARRPPLVALLGCGMVCVLLGAGSVVAAVTRAGTASALSTYTLDTRELKRADLDRALASDGASPDRLVVTYVDGSVDQATLDRVHQAVGGTPLLGDRTLGLEVLRVSSSGAASAVERVRDVPGVADAGVEQVLTSGAASIEIPTPLIVHPDSTAGSANDPLAAYAWGVSRIGANQVWSASRGGGVKVAVLDCGIHAAHPDLAGQVVLDKNFSDAATSDDGCNHGTLVAGVIAALTNNGIGVPSVAPAARLMNGKVLDDSGHGFSSDVDEGIVWAADNGARVINLSLGADVACPPSMQSAIAYARSKGAVIVAAAGNASLPRPAAPAGCRGVVSVGAVDKNDLKAAFSNTGSLLAAPGVAIGSTFNPDINDGALYGTASGTSLAAPYVAGVAALVWASTATMSPDVVVARLEGTAERSPGTGSLWTYGRVSALMAIAPPLPPTSTTSIPASATDVPIQVTDPARMAPTVVAEPVADVPTPATAKPTLVPTAAATARPRSGAAVVPAPELTAPTSAPGGVTATPLGNGKVEITWLTTLDGPATFTVYRGDVNGANLHVLAIGVTSTTRTFVDSTAQPGLTLTYAVAAQTGAGEGPHSRPVRTGAVVR